MSGTGLKRVLEVSNNVSDTDLNVDVIETANVEDRNEFVELDKRTEFGDQFGCIETPTSSSSKSRHCSGKRKLSSVSFVGDSLNEGDRELLERDDEKRDFVGPIRNNRRRSVEQCGPLNADATRCARFTGRRDALCDPFKLLIPQTMREQLEQKVEKRKTSVSRKVSNFLTVSLDLNRDEELI